MHGAKEVETAQTSGSTEAEPSDARDVNVLDDATGAVHQTSIPMVQEPDAHIEATAKPAHTANASVPAADNIGSPIAKQDAGPSGSTSASAVRHVCAHSNDASSLATTSDWQVQHEPDEAQPPVRDAQLAEEQDLEPDIYDSNDSALGSDTCVQVLENMYEDVLTSLSRESTTTSLSESIYNYRKEHGRTYHAYKDGKYIFPNDEREADRLDLQHHLFRLTFGNRLFFAPLQTPKRCLDIGTGTGIWAMEFADDFPHCEVMGTDLSPGQPTLVPPNLKFLVDDAEDLWIYDQPFDFIHARLMAGCFADWPNFFRQAYHNLEPGGWLELQDYGLPVKSSDGTHADTDIMRWGELLCEAGRNLGRAMGSDVSDHYVRWMQEAGFVDIEQRMFMWPTNPWPKDPLMKELGRWNHLNILEGLEGFCLALLIRGLGWKKEEVDVLVAKVSTDLRNRKIHAYFPMPVTLGRKPFPHETVFH